MADKTFLLRLAVEGGEAIVKGLDQVGDAGDKAGSKIKHAFEAQATPAARGLEAALTEGGRAVENYAGQLGSLGRVLQSFGPKGLLVAGAVGGITATVVALGGHVKSVVNDLDDLGDIAARLNISAESLQALRLGARSAGFNLTDADSSLQQLKDARDKALSGLHGADRALSAFAAFGISRDDLANATTMEQLLDKIAVGAKNMGDATKAGADLAVLGIQAIAQTIDDAGGDWDGFLKQLVAGHKVIDENVVKQAGEVKDAWEAMANDLYVSVAPAFVDLGKVATPVLKEMELGLRLAIAAARELAEVAPSVIGKIQTYTAQAVVWSAYAPYLLAKTILGGKTAGPGPLDGVAGDAAYTGSTLSGQRNLGSPKFGPGFFKTTPDALRSMQTQIELNELDRKEAEGLQKVAAAAESAAEKMAKLAQHRQLLFDHMRISSMDDVAEHVEKGVDAQVAAMEKTFQARLDFKNSFRDNFTSALVEALKSGDVATALDDFLGGIQDRLYKKFADTAFDQLWDSLDLGNSPTLKSIFGDGGGPEVMGVAATTASTALAEFTAAVATATIALSAHSLVGGISGGASDLIGAGISALFGGGKAVGGPAYAGRSYIVGEAGPELVIAGRQL